MLEGPRDCKLAVSEHAIEMRGATPILVDGLYHDHDG
jgi:hypothetical protein